MKDRFYHVQNVFIMCDRHLELPFHWQIRKPNLQCLLPGETPDPSRIQHHAATDSVFSISPAIGMLAPAQECVFLLTYCPKEVHRNTHTHTHNSHTHKCSLFISCILLSLLVEGLSQCLSPGHNERPKSAEYS